MLLSLLSRAAFSMLLNGKLRLGCARASHRFWVSPGVLSLLTPKMLRLDGLMTCFVISSRKAENCNFPCTKFSLAILISAGVTSFPLSLPLPCLFATRGDSTSIDLALRMSGGGSRFLRIPLPGIWLEDTPLWGLRDAPSTRFSSLNARLRPKLAVL